MAAVDQLTANPLEFLKKNILIPGIYGPPRDSLKDEPIDMRLVSMPPADGYAKQLGEPLGIYIVTVPGLVDSIVTRGGVDDGKSFKAYFCSYEPGAVFGTTVGAKADFMFTAQMDGCSLGVGHKTSSGTRLVYHANKGGNAGRQQDDLNEKMGANQAAVLSPKDYRVEANEGHLASTTMGIRTASTNDWNFYAQIYADDKGMTNFGTRKQQRTYFLRQVKKFL
ncbi:hypothetical protein [Sphingomonas sp. Leaf343]|uniref:hypothetical protein n=1 Tax=Sphingomonas sp. Leaf343 TaxID=1736345 RepID=UPI000AD6199C|nr:hypothetical protein [Sphingomonas sp. Leaf343]